VSSLQNKCERYWPLNLDEVEIFGTISISVIAYVNENAYDLRCIQLKKVKTFLLNYIEKALIMFCRIMKFVQ